MQVLNILKPIIRHVEIIDISNERIALIESLQNTLNSLGIKYCSFKEIDEDAKYLVFGSFSVVEEFLRVYNE